MINPEFMGVFTPWTVAFFALDARANKRMNDFPSDYDQADSRAVFFALIFDPGIDKLGVVAVGISLFCCDAI